jgi:hypothetical protein
MTVEPLLRPDEHERTLSELSWSRSRLSREEESPSHRYGTAGCCLALEDY